MSTLVVAKKEFKDGIRSRVLLALTIIFTLYIIYNIYSFTVLSQFEYPNAQRQATDAVAAMRLPIGQFLAVIGTLVGYNAIAGERNSGSLKLLLGLPHTRRDAILGKLLGRWALLTVAVVVGLACGIVVTVVIAGVLPPMGAYLGLAGMAVLVGAVFVSIAMAFSSGVRSQKVLVWGAFGLALLFALGWELLMFFVRVLGRHFELYNPPPHATVAWVPNWQQFLREFNPVTAYRRGIATIHNIRVGGFSIQAGGTVGLDVPFYLHPWFGFVILAFWLVVPLGLAYTRFRRMELR